MTTAAPARQTGLPVNLSLTANGTAIDPDRIVSIETWSQANCIPRARIVLLDGDADSGDAFASGSKINIAAGYESDSEPIHAGVVVRHSLRIAPGAGAQLVVETADPLLRMTLARHSAVTMKTTDAKIISALVSASGGILRTNMAATDETEAVVQAHVSDWNLLLLRAEASGCLVFVDARQVDILSPTAASRPVLTLEYGDSIISFDATADATLLLGDAPAQAAVTGTVAFQGSALVKAGSRVTLANLGDRFNGDAFVSGVRHLIGSGNWQTIAELGTPAGGSRIADAPARGHDAPLRGLQTGEVKQVAEDPNGDFRVLVTLPTIDGANGIWARLAQPYASDGFGWSFSPEVGDEVVLGFMNEDPASAVVIASVYSNQRAPAHVPNRENDVKALVTRSKMEVSFNDRDVVLKISTPGGRSVELNDKTGTITVEDPDKNKLVMTKSQVDLISTAKLNIKSTGDMNIDCGANLTVTANAKCEITAVQIEGTAKSKLALMGTAQASFTSSAMVEIDGALVKIN